MNLHWLIAAPSPAQYFSWCYRAKYVDLNNSLTVIVFFINKYRVHQQ